MTWISVAVVIALTALVGWLPRVAQGLEQRLAHFEIARRPFLLASGATFALAFYLRLIPLLAAPLPFAADIERLYRIAAYSAWDHLFDPRDYHHPGLWFALLHWPFRLSGYSHLVPAGLGRLCAVLVVPVVGVVVARQAGRVAGLAAMLNVALLPFLTVQARQIGDVTLYMLIGVGALWCYSLVRERASLARTGALIAMLTLALNASYSGPVLLAALSADAILRSRGRWVLIGAVATSWLLGAPRWMHLLKLMPFEFGIRSDITTLNVTHWANVDTRSFLVEAGTDFLTSEYPWLLVLLLAALWAGRTLLRREMTEVTWGLLAHIVFLATYPVLRMRPYYASLLPILLLVRIAALAAPRREGEEMSAAASRRGLALLASLACSLAYAVAIARQVPNVSADAPRTLIEVAIADGATRLASTNWTETTWFFFDDPITTMVPCFSTLPASHCGSMQGYTEEAASHRRFYLLENSLLAQDPYGLVPQLQEVRAMDTVHVLTNAVSPFDTAIIDYVRTSCTELRRIDAWGVWRCASSK